jgi:hypothetical protein
MIREADRLTPETTVNLHCISRRRAISRRTRRFLEPEQRRLS